MKYRDKIIQYFEELPAGNIVSANELYEMKFTAMSESAFFKAMERLAKDGILNRAAKGMYAMPMKDQKNESMNYHQEQVEAASLESEDGNEAVLNFFFGEDNSNGMYIGSRLYVKYGLSNVLDDVIELYSNAITKETSTVGNIKVRRVGLELSFENTRVIEALEILQHYDQIENLNKIKFAKYARQYARNYNNDAAVYVIEHMKYKKNTIAFMKKILDMYKVKNTLQQYLSYASRYKIPPVQRVAR
jgi:hypothetical protein